MYGFYGCYVKVISRSLLLTSGHRYSRYQSECDEQVVGERDAEIAEHIGDCEQTIEEAHVKVASRASRI